MSLASERIAEFLNRAKVINSKSKSIDTQKQSISPLRNANYSPISFKKSSISPNSHQSFSSTHDDTPLPTNRKFILSGTFNRKKQVNFPVKEKVEKKQAKPVAPERKKESIIEKAELEKKNWKIKEIKMKVEEFVGNSSENKNGILGKNVESNSEKDAQIKAIETKCKQKMQKMVEIFKEEALKTDQKLQQLQEENKNLKEILNNPQLPATKSSKRSIKSVVNQLAFLENEGKYLQTLDSLCRSCKKTIKCTEDYTLKISNWFECLGISPEDYSNFLPNVCLRIIQEQKKRLKTEEETGKMIEFEENLIKELENKVSYAENMARRASCGIIHDMNDEELHVFDKDKVMKNLDMVISKKSRN